MRRAIRAEWAKTWSDPGTGWLLGTLIALTVAVSAVAIGTARCPAAGCGQDPARISLTGVYLGQAVAALVGVAAIGSEYGTGMIRVSLTAIPRRDRLLAAKAVVLAGPVLAASAAAAGASMLAGWLVLPGHGFTARAWIRSGQRGDVAGSGRCGAVPHAGRGAWPWRDFGRARLSRRHRYRARAALPVPGRRRPGRQPGHPATPAAGRPNVCRPGQHDHGQAARPATHPVAGPRGSRHVGCGRSRPRRRDASPTRYVIISAHENPERHLVMPPGMHGLNRATRHCVTGGPPGGRRRTSRWAASAA